MVVNDRNMCECTRAINCLSSYFPIDILSSYLHGSGFKRYGESIILTALLLVIVVLFLDKDIPLEVTVSWEVSFVNHGD